VGLSPAWTQSLVAHWKFDENTGTVARNAVKNSPDGELLSFPEDNSQWVKGKLNGAIQFDGMDDHISISNFPYSAKGTFTIMFWYNCSVNQGEHYRYIFSQGGPGNWENNSVFIYFSRVYTQRTRVLDYNDNTKDTYLDLPIEDMAPADGRWHHYAMTVSREGALVFIDGKQTGILNCGGEKLNPSYDIVLGTRNNKMENRFYDGILDDLRIYDYTLSEDQIREACGCKKE
jgi:hypothetical protein